MLCRCGDRVCLDGLRGVLASDVMVSDSFPFVPMPAWLHGRSNMRALRWTCLHPQWPGDRPVACRLAYRPWPFLIVCVARICPLFLAVLISAVAIQPLATGFERMAWLGPTVRRATSGPVVGRALGACSSRRTDDDLRAIPNGVLPDVWGGFLGAAWSLSTEWQFILLALLIGERLGLRRMAGCSWRCRPSPSHGRWRSPRPGSSAARSCRTRRSTSHWG